MRYWPQKGASGFIVWRYELRRDDPTPPPWTQEGKKRIQEMGYEMIYPEGYLEAQAEKAKLAEKDGNTPKSKKRKQQKDEGDGDGSFVVDDDTEENNDSSPAAKKQKTTFKIPSEWRELIDKDVKNANLWEQVAEKAASNRKELTDFVEEMFGCIVCMDIVFKPVTTHCKHNICLPCLKRSFEADTFSCSACIPPYQGPALQRVTDSSP